jgi:MFS transporter, MFS domain-containing protein family, molybdate-anion transporter
MLLLLLLLRLDLVQALPRLFFWNRKDPEAERLAAILASREASRERRIGPLEQQFDDPAKLFDACLAALTVTVVMAKFVVWQMARHKAKQQHLELQQLIHQNAGSSKKESHPSKDNNSHSHKGTTNTFSTPGMTSNNHNKPEWARLIQLRFLPVFWLIRTAFWMSGPYFYAVYASKMVNGEKASTKLLSQIFLAGFASVALIGPLTGRAFDRYGRKKGTIAAALVYSLGACSTQSNLVSVLFVGRGLGGVGTSMLSNAPESWLVSEFQRSGDDGTWLYDTFSLAFAGDSIVAIVAGQIAGAAASRRGPTGPFEVSPFFLAAAALLASVFWNESKAYHATTTTTSANSSSSSSSDTTKTSASSSNSTINDLDGVVPNGRGSIWDATQLVWTDPKILAIGAIQSIFEASMYVFVMQWPPILNAAIQYNYGEYAETPYGTVFSCFMACCLLGSTLFGQLGKWGVPRLISATVMLTVATLSLAYATYAVGNTTTSLTSLIAAFFVYEACVGMYFPCIGLLRSQYLPDSHRAVIMTLFGVPLNVIVVGVFLCIHSLGSKGALGIATGALGTIVLYIIQLQRIIAEEKRRRARNCWAILQSKIQSGHVVYKKGKHRRVRSRFDMNYNRQGVGGLTS